MRKPDGTSVEDTLRLASRLSISNSDGSGPGAAAHVGLGGMRRKSMLPKASALNHGRGGDLRADGRTLGENEGADGDSSADEEGVDAFLLGGGGGSDGDEHGMGLGSEREEERERARSDSPLTDLASISESSSESSALGLAIEDDKDNENIEPSPSWSSSSFSEETLSTLGTTAVSATATAFMPEHVPSNAMTSSRPPSARAPNRTSPRKGSASSTSQAVPKPPSRRTSILPKPSLQGLGNGNALPQGRRREVLNELPGSNHALAAGGKRVVSGGMRPSGKDGR